MSGQNNFLFKEDMGKLNEDFLKNKNPAKIVVEKDAGSVNIMVFLIMKVLKAKSQNSFLRNLVGLLPNLPG